MSWALWWAFLITHTTLCLIPGPAVLMVAGTGLRRGSRAGAVSACGIVSANTFYFVLSGMGIGALLLASHEVFSVLRWIGASYLAYLGLRIALGNLPWPYRRRG